LGNKINKNPTRFVAISVLTLPLTASNSTIYSIELINTRRAYILRNNIFSTILQPILAGILHFTGVNYDAENLAGESKFMKLL